MTIKETTNFSLEFENIFNMYNIKRKYHNDFITVSSMYANNSNNIITESAEDNFQTYVCTFELFQEYIMLIDEAYYLLKK